ncbi:DUF4381 domain-containing protein [Vibrio quintilis]|uniref:DUF4381 domain-containing protein n=1 Tax=Vibrio quintilis TaxID=1117707 RepID=A0A1M7YPS0_9VIBR|nr:DUF4381 domain-containing protein [Vibrio quintilis]SHO54622.1 hypothetical protein VQ7734_00336 [Vibrio quintilis]
MAKSISNLLDLKPLHLPPAPSWWPLGWGWISLIACTVVVILLVLWIVSRYRRWTAPKKTALRLLQPQHGQITPSDAMELVRQASLFYYPRQKVAHLTGRDWYKFLDQQLGQSLFVPNEALWQQALYQASTPDETQRLINDCCAWVQGALPPKRKNRR